MRARITHTANVSFIWATFTPPIIGRHIVATIYRCHFLSIILAILSSACIPRRKPANMRYLPKHHDYAIFRA